MTTAPVCGRVREQFHFLFNDIDRFPSSSGSQKLNDAAIRVMSGGRSATLERRSDRDRGVARLDRRVTGSLLDRPVSRARAMTG
jgi:hypothetical protein